MRPALLILLAAIAMTSASATTPTPAALKLAPGVAMSTPAPHGETISPTPNTHAQTTAAIQTVAMASPAEHDRARLARQSTDKADAQGHALAPLAITLALIGAIAMRRRQGGKS